MAYTTINKSTDYFNTKLYTGNSTDNHAITGVNFQPDLVWIKRRNQAANHNLFDAVRGATKTIKSNLTNAEATVADTLKSFDSDGFTLGDDATVGEVNPNTYTMASWNWKANGQGSSNTDGSINTTYTSVSTTAGFSICKWTGTGANGTIGHGLGTVPTVIIVKNLGTTENWVTYHKPLGATKYLKLNDTSAEGTSSDVWNNTSPTSSVFYVGSNTATNQSGNQMIAYCFAPKTGYSKFGSYVGNGNADGTFLYTGFKPAWILFKEASQSGQSWYIWDTTRDDNGNPLEEYIAVDGNGAEGGSGSTYMDYNSNGVKMRDTGTYLNGSGQTYVYMAFGQSIVGSNNVPAVAR